MFKYISKRTILAVFTLFIIMIFSLVLVVSFITNPYETASLTVSDPFQLKILQAKADEFANTPIINKIIDYFAKFFRGDFGGIYIMKTPYKNIPDLFFKPLKWSLLVSLPAFFFSAIIGIFLGVFAGYKRGTFYDSIINVFITIFIAIPSFIIAPFFINLFSKFGFSTHFISPYDKGSSWITTINSVIPPILVVTLGSLAVYTLYSRNQTVSVLTSNYILIAKTKGLSGSKVFFRYVLRNISIPLSALILPSYIILLSGSIIIEKFWSIPGSSTVIAQAFPAGEINVVMFNIFFFTALSLGTGILVDISYAFLDPRIKYSSNSSRNYAKLISSYYARKKEIKEYLEKGVINEQ